jgi:hypothetical protein
MPSETPISRETWTDLVQAVVVAGQFSGLFERIVRFFAERVGDPELGRLAVTALVMRFRAAKTPGVTGASVPAGAVPALVRRCDDLPLDAAARGLAAVARLEYAEALKALAELRGNSAVLDHVVHLLRRPDEADLAMFAQLLAAGLPFTEAETAAMFVMRFDASVSWVKPFVAQAARRGDLITCIRVFELAVEAGLTAAETDLAMYYATNGSEPSVAVTRAPLVIRERTRRGQVPFQATLAALAGRRTAPERTQLRLRATAPPAAGAAVDGRPRRPAIAAAPAKADVTIR